MGIVVTYFANPWPKIYKLLFFRFNHGPLSIKETDGEVEIAMLNRYRGNPHSASKPRPLHFVLTFDFDRPSHGRGESRGDPMFERLGARAR